MVYKPLYSTMHSHGLVSEIGYGFQQKRSTTALLLQAVDDWSITLEQRSTVHCLFLDFSKAFDSVAVNLLCLCIFVFMYFCCS